MNVYVIELEFTGEYSSMPTCIQIEVFVYEK